jgi:hypothetical protein
VKAGREQRSETCGSPPSPGKAGFRVTALTHQPMSQPMDQPVDQPVKMKYFQSPCVVEFTLSPDVPL